MRWTVLATFVEPCRRMIYTAVRAVVLLCVITSPAAAFQAGLSGRPAIAQRASAVVLAETITDTMPGTCMLYHEVFADALDGSPLCATGCEPVYAQFVPSLQQVE